MHRRSNDVEGMVNFPVKFLPNGGEGGMLVQLWIIDSRSDGYGVCCGTQFTASVSECFIGSDITKKQQLMNNNKISKLWENINSDEAMEYAFKKESALRKSVYKHFFQDDIYNETSTLLLANILMGSTGWSNSEFIAEYTDLTDTGKTVYDNLKLAYPEATFALMTFLDT